MMKTKLMVLLILQATASAYACSECKDKGYVVKWEQCPLCMGRGSVSPTYYGKRTGRYISNHDETMWRVSTRLKKYSYMKCPVCANSRTKGSICTASPCDCGKPLDKINLSNYNSLKRIIPSKLLGDIPATNDFLWTRLAIEKKCWLMDSKNLTSVVTQAVTGEYRTEDATGKNDVDDLD